MGLNKQFCLLLLCYNNHYQFTNIRSVERTLNNMDVPMTQRTETDSLWNNTPEKKVNKITDIYLIMKDITMNKLYICKISENFAVCGGKYFSKNFNSVKNKKITCRILTLDIWITSSTFLSTRLWNKLLVAIDKSLLIKRTTIKNQRQS